VNLGAVAQRLARGDANTWTLALSRMRHAVMLLARHSLVELGGADDSAVASCAARGHATSFFTVSAHRLLQAAVMDGMRGSEVGAVVSAAAVSGVLFGVMRDHLAVSPDLERLPRPFAVVENVGKVVRFAVVEHTFALQWQDGFNVLDRSAWDGRCAAAASASASGSGTAAVSRSAGSDPGPWPVDAAIDADYFGDAAGVSEDSQQRVLRWLMGTEAARWPLLQRVSVFLRERAVFVEAAALCTMVRDAALLRFGADHRDTLAATHTLGLVIRDQGHYHEARTMLSAALEGRRRVLGETHMDTLWSKNHTAVVLFALGEHAVAEELQRDALRGFTDALGADHADTLTSANNLANVLKARGKLDETDALLTDTLARRRALLGPDHPDTLWTLNNLANLRLAQVQSAVVCSQWGAVSSVQSVACSQWGAVSVVLSVGCSQLCAVSCVQSVVCSQLCAVSCVRSESVVMPVRSHGRRDLLCISASTTRRWRFMTRRWRCVATCLVRRTR
jgi:hypothetical protein